jgi:hypothetical protein
MRQRQCFAAFCKENGFTEEADFFRKSAAMLEASGHR